MTCDVICIRFKGRKYVLTDNSLESSPIATAKAYAEGKCSYAHLYADGTISRFGKRIGTRDDIEVLGTGKVKIKAGSLWNLPTMADLIGESPDPSWLAGMKKREVDRFYGQDPRHV